MSKTFLNEGDVVEIQGSGKNPYKVRKIGGVVDCSCPAWRNLGGPIDVRVCKHIKANIDPACLLPQAQGVASGKPAAPVAAKSVAVKKETAPPVLLAHPWEKENPTGWWMSEKLDGVRAWWDGEKFISRLGNIYHAPESFTKLLPKITLDGELWVGRKLFQKTISTVRKLVPTESEWADITYVVYDMPLFPGTFEQRTAELMKILPTLKVGSGAGVGQVCVLEQIMATSLAHMLDYLKRVEGFGGEGIMLRASSSKYEAGRSHTLLKVKTFKDSEATVVGHTAGKGKYKGMCGALEVDWNGVRFELGTGLTDSERKNPPAIGSIVTFSYTDLTDSGVPKCGAFISVRDYE